MLVFALQGAALLILSAVPGVAGVLLFVLAFGMGNGMTTLMRASLVAELFGRAHYGAVSGAMSMWATLARAVAPVSVGVLYPRLGGYPAILVMLAAASVVAVGAAGRALAPPAAPPGGR